MELFKKYTPHRFNYKPRYYKPPGNEEETPGTRLKGKFTSRSPRKAKKPYVLFVLFVLVAAILYMLGGVPKSLKDVELCPEDVIGKGDGIQTGLSFLGITSLRAGD